MADYSKGKVQLEAQIKQLQSKIAKLEQVISENKGKNTNNDNFKSLYENATIGIYRTTLDGKILMANDALVKMLGYTSFAELPNIQMHDIYTDMNERSKFIDKALKEGKVIGFETNFRKKDGSEISVRINSRLIKIDDKKEYLIEGTLEDISEKKIAEKQLIASKEKAEEMNRLKGNFLASMSHELRTPLVGILGFAEIFKNELQDPEQLDMAESIYSSGRRLMETLNSILDYSRLEARKIEINKRPVNVSHLVTDAVRSFSNIAEKNNLYLKLKIVDEKTCAELDAHIFNKIIFNLLNNAIKYTKQGGVVVEVNSSTADKNRHSIIKIKDSGIGIQESTQNIIFEEFRQASEGVNRQYEGSGLGLTITKKFTELQGGQIFLESKVGKGSTFILQFPECKIEDETINSSLHQKKYNQFG
jgi:PAS domain S-box-containing protein